MAGVIGTAGINRKLLWEILGPAGILCPGILVVLTVLVCLSFRETLPEETKTPFYERPFRRSAVFLYRKIERRRSRGNRAAGKRGAGTVLARAAREDLQILYPSVTPGRQEREYLLRKITRLLEFLLLSAVLPLLVKAAAYGAGAVEAGGRIVRDDYGGTEKEVLLSTERDGEYALVVEPRKYSSSQLETLASEAGARLPELIRGENRDLQHVEKDLVFPSALEGLPFELTWDSSCYELIDPSGRVYAGQIPEDEREEVTLETTLRYDDWRKTLSFTAFVTAPARSGEERRKEEIGEALLLLEEESREEKELVLPKQVGGIPVSFREIRTDRSGTVFFLLFTISLLSWFVSDSRLRERVSERENELERAYPVIVSKLSLYVGSGMSVRNAFSKIGRQKTRAGGGYAVEEVRRTLREIENGIPEQEAYERFGRRCRLQCYTRFSTLLVRNLRKGNDELLRILSDEAAAAFEKRKALARQKGEEAGTKLLLPMMLMLGVTLVMIMIPAYLGFSV